MCKHNGNFPQWIRWIGRLSYLVNTMTTDDLAIGGLGHQQPWNWPIFPGINIFLLSMCTQVRLSVSTFYTETDIWLPLYTGHIEARQLSICCPLYMRVEHFRTVMWIYSWPDVSTKQFSWCFIRVCSHITVLILGLRPTNERRRYRVRPSLIGWAQSWNRPSISYVSSNHMITLMRLTYTPAAVYFGSCVQLAKP